ncbi:hypothetical protein KTH_48520 [Thermosporothrix hazakensis]|nr:hypothetical protein KTH_48520 [Thermosporothrix hazakensis]
MCDADSGELGEDISHMFIAGVQGHCQRQLFDRSKRTAIDGGNGSTLRICFKTGMPYFNIPHQFAKNEGIYQLIL